jgi:CheY-like chemotaxis protein
MSGRNWPVSCFSPLASMGKENVLVVEDDDTIRRLLVEYLKQHSYLTVDGARDGVDALHQISSERYGVVILDLMMPHMSGVDFLDSLMALGTDPSFKRLEEPPTIVIVTATSAAEIPSQLLVQRCELVREVFRKPVDMVALAECVEDHLRQRSSRLPSPA